MEKYLSFVRRLFTNSRSFCEERALYFLSQCSYNVETAMHLLATPEVDEDEAAAAAGGAEQDEQDTAAEDAEDGGGGGAGGSGSGATEQELEEWYEHHDDLCTVCRDGGQLILCDYDGCKKGAAQTLSLSRIHSFFCRFRCVWVWVWVWSVL